MPDDTTGPAPVTAEGTAPSDLPASPTAGSNDLRERYAAAAAEWALMYPISSWALAVGERAEGLARVWGEQIARFLDEAVRDKEVEQLRAELDRLKFAAKTITENDWYGRLARAEAELERIHHAVTDTYGEDYAGGNVAAEVERLFRHLSEFETNMGQVLGAKSEALERAQADRNLLRETLAESDLGAQVLAQWEAIAAADSDRDRLEAELAEAKAERDTNFSVLQRVSEGGWESATELVNERIARKQAERERTEAKRAVDTAQITHIRDTHPDRMYEANCLVCHVLVPLSAAMPSRPDDPEEIRRLIQATTEETHDG